MITFIQFLITGLRLGSVYALIALGYTMVYGIIKLINFAHGDFIMVGGYSLFFIIPVMMAAGIPGWLAVVPAVLICACVGMLVELLAYRQQPDLPHHRHCHELCAGESGAGHSRHRA